MSILNTAVIFDLDGVLIDSEALQHKAYSAVLARFGVSVGTEEYARHWIAEGRGPEYAVETFHLPFTPEDLRREKGAVYFDILCAEVTLMPGVREALERLQPHFRLGVATNSNRRDVGFIMEKFGLTRFFTAITTREDYVNAKPAPDAFATAAHSLGTAPDRCLVVEDAQRGVLAADAAGMKVVAVPNRFTRNNDFSRAARVLTSLDELTVDLVQELIPTAA